MLEIEQSISKNTISQGYIKSLDLFSRKYTKALSSIYTNRTEIFEILHLLIDKIIVYSRPLTGYDKVAGRKKQNQQLPYKLEIKLKLPKDIMATLMLGFGAKNAPLWGHRDSNPEPIA